MAIESLLEEIGLTKGEIKVYLALLELGATTTGKIIEKSGVSGSKTYEILERLIQKGLVSFIVKGEVKYFEATHPERILDYLEEKELRLQKQRDLAKKIIPSLGLKQQFAGNRNNATIYTGINGIKSAFLRAKKEAQKGDVYLGLFIPRVDDRLVQFFEQFTKDFCSKIGKAKLLFNEPSQELDTIKNLKGVEVKLLSEQFRVPAEVCVIGDHVLISTTAGTNFMSLLIKNKEMADSFTAQFFHLWNQDVHVFRGKAGVQAVFDETLKHKDVWFIGGNWGIKRFFYDYWRFNNRRFGF